MSIPNGPFDVLRAQISSFRASLTSGSSQEHKRQFNELSREYARLKGELSPTVQKSIGSFAEVQDLLREFRVLREAIANPQSLQKRTYQPFRFTDVDNKGLALTGVGGMVLSFGLPAAYASVAWPVSLTALSLLGAKKVYDTCCYRPAKVKVERDSVEPSSTVRRGTGTRETLRQRRDIPPPPVPLSRRPEEKKRPEPESKPSFRSLPSPMPVPSLGSTGTVRPYFKADHHAQIVQFRTWAATAQKRRDWSQFHNGHFDWWAFPIDQKSRGYGEKYHISYPEVIALKSDPSFMKEYREGVHHVLASWGYDLSKGSHGQLVNNGGKYAGGTRNIRIWKILKSLKLFGERELFDKVNAYAAMLGQPQRWDRI